MLITRSFSLTNFCVASSALAFQVFVLYPWHQKLDEDFEELKHEHLRVLAAIQGVSIKDRQDIHDRLSKLHTKSIVASTSDSVKALSKTRE
ncbi:hypothetical protein K504DRAFT_461714 [Pleomassaria siparia CBS 279.74]|uniref:Mitochondrial phosphate carrier protein n=1 Tax=Pleomassaria siparia CBS 279.74 TaxID=1314801 RepID=A0A6G1KKI0_9PLEO|nr:hypothetical protein K504DRAFT_461714 [Pleomassaria siparia CBS 279.74]